MIKKLFVGFIITLLLFTNLWKYVIIILLILLLLWVIRKIADIFWWGKDNGKW